MPSLVNEGLQLAAIGMGTVFVFLTLLVLATMAMTSLVGRWTPPPDPDPAQIDRRKLAAITAAVHQHRSR